MNRTQARSKRPNTATGITGPVAGLLWFALLLIILTPLDGAAQETMQFSFRLEKGRLVSGPDVMKVKQGDRVSLLWRSQKEAEIHLHGYDLKLAIRPGEPAKLGFDAVATGRFPVTLHGHGSRGHKALSYLEVHPR